MQQAAAAEPSRESPKSYSSLIKLHSAFQGGHYTRPSNSDTTHDLPTMPLLPNLKFHPQDIRYNQHDRENIMLKTGSGSSNLHRKKSKSDGWSLISFGLAFEDMGG